MPFTFTPLSIPDVLVIEPHFTGDTRGFLLETYKRSAFEQAGIRDAFVQQNHSRSVKGVLRGLHYQMPPYSQAKLIRVLKGEIFDVAVDIRHGSPTRGQWAGSTLSADSRAMMYVPRGCAHGFCVVSDEADVEYFMSGEYSPAHERGLMWNDPVLGIAWPVTSPTLSARDTRWPPFDDAIRG